MAHKWKNRQKVEIDPTKYVPANPLTPKKYIKSRQCAAVFTKGRRAGTRCSWYARPDSIYCRRHGRNEGNILSEEHVKALRKGAADWWTRMRALEAKQPGIIRRMFNTDKAVETRMRRKAVAKTLPMPPGAKEDKMILRAHKAIVNEIADLPAVPDKPFDQLEPHEQMVVNTRIALSRANEILCLPFKDEAGVVDPKIASIVKDATFRTIAAAVKIDRNVLAARKIDRMADLLERLKAGEGAKVIEGS